MNTATPSFYLAPNGNDTWSGRLPAPNAAGTDGPFATPERAQAALRALKRDGELPPGGVTIWLRGGQYQRTDTLALTADDSGTPEAPIVWRACVGEEVRFIGGCIVDAWHPVTDTAMLARLDPAARPFIRCADLTALGITDFGTLSSRGFGRTHKPAHLELFFQDRPMTLARWPNDDFVTIADYAEAVAGGDGHGSAIGTVAAGFYYAGDRPTRWQQTDDIWVHGYWCWDWANSYEQIAVLDTERRLIVTRPTNEKGYGYRAGQRYYYMNIFEELDEPGEFFLDRQTGMLYFWPPAAEGEAIVSILETPFITMEHVSDVTIRGLRFECSRGTGITVRDGARVRIEGCTLCNLGNCGVLVTGGNAHTVSGCDVYEVGDAGIRITGGDVNTLIPAGHLAHNNHVYRFARWSRCYQGGVDVYGVGNRVAHNLIHDAPHTGILFGGNDLLIEYNEIHHVTLETGDCGAIYSGRTWLRRGNTVRHNFIHHTGGVGMGSMGVYLDDQLSGINVIGNVFWQATRAAFIGGGCNNRVENNIFVDCEPAIHVDGRGMVWGQQVVNLKKEVKETPPEVLALYRQRYPELATFDSYLYTDDLVPPINNVIARNAVAGGRWIDISWGATPEYVPLGENQVEATPYYVEMANGGFRLRDDAPAWAFGFERIPVERIGLVKDELRPLIGRVSATLELLQCPSAENGQRSELRLTLDNTGDLPAEGVVELRVSPAGAAQCVDESGCAFILLPGESMMRDFMLDVRQGAFTIETFSTEPTFVPATIVVKPGRWIIRRFSAPASVERVAEALRDGAVQRVIWQDAVLAEVRIGLTEGALAVHATINDPTPVRTEQFWRGSCFEVFAAKLDDGEVGQVVLLPPVGSATAHALVYRHGSPQRNSQMQWRTASTADGYCISALIPLDELGIETVSDSFLIEIATGIAPPMNGATRYAMLSGSSNAFENCSRFCPVEIRDE